VNTFEPLTRRTLTFSRNLGRKRGAITLAPTDCHNQARQIVSTGEEGGGVTLSSDVGKASSEYIHVLLLPASCFLLLYLCSCFLLLPLPLPLPLPLLLLLLLLLFLAGLSLLSGAVRAWCNGRLAV
jgi:hypothetical protein